MAIKQTRASLPSNAYLVDKENVNPFQNFFFGKGNGVSHQKCKSPLPVGFPRAPLQDITSVIHPIKVFRDSPQRCNSKRAKAEAQISESVVCSGKTLERQSTRLIFASIKDYAEEHHYPVTNSAETGDNNASSSIETEHSTPLSFSIKSAHGSVSVTVHNSVLSSLETKPEAGHVSVLNSSEIESRHSSVLISSETTGNDSVLDSSESFPLPMISSSVQKRRRNHYKLSMSDSSRPSMKSTQRNCKHSSILKFR